MPEQPKLRILHVVPRLTVGGAETMMVRLIRSLDTAEFEVAAVSLFPRAGSSLERSLEAAGVAVSYLNKQAGLDLRLFGRLNAVLKKFRPDVVHTHLTALAHALPVLLWRRQTAILHTVHSMAEKEASGPCRAMHRAAFRAGAIPVSIARAVEDSMVRLYHTPRRLLIPNGVPLDEFREASTERHAFRRDHGLPPDAMLFVTAGRLTPAKNQVLLVDAFAAAFPADDRCHLVIVGDGPLEAQLRDRAAAAGVGARVHLLGLCHDMPRVLGAADAFVLSSDWEGHPLTVMEAMAAGLPVISTAVGGVPEIVADGVTGILVPKGDGQALSRAMQSLSAGVELRTAMGRAAATASRAFDLGVMAAAYAGAYRDLAGRAVAPRSSAIPSGRTTLQQRGSA